MASIFPFSSNSLMIHVCRHNIEYGNASFHFVVRLVPFRATAAPVRAGLHGTGAAVVSAPAFGSIEVFGVSGDRLASPAGVSALLRPVPDFSFAV